jgi:histidinol-phosphatase (PHP family)
MKLPPDYHMHTPFCGHAHGGPADYVARAREVGMEELAFTDHAPAPDGYDAVNRMDLSGFPAYAAAVDAYRDGTAPAVRLGVEADYYEGGTAFLAAWLPRQPLDIVLGSVHYIADWPFDHPDHIAAWNSKEVAWVWQRYFDLLGHLADTRLFDVVAHLDLPKKFGHFADDALLREVAAPALDRLAAAGMSIELNTSGLRRPCREIYPSLLLLTMARERDIAITFGSDAHTPEDVGHAFPEAVKLARQAGYTHSARYAERRKTLVPLPED